MNIFQFVWFNVLILLCTLFNMGVTINFAKIVAEMAKSRKL